MIFPQWFGPRARLGAALLVVAGALAMPARADATETYLFRHSFAPLEGAGNVLVPVSNSTGTIVTSGPDFVNGTFADVTISASACASTPTIRGWSFPDRGGLRYANTSPTLVTGSYTISMLMRYDPMDLGYARLIDFSNSTQDTGIYKLGHSVSFYPVGVFADGSFVSGQDVFVTITRDGATKLVSLYINGVPSGTYSDVNGDLYAPSATVVYFFMDNTTGAASIGETDPGVITYLQVRDAPISAEEVAASLATICGAVSCGDGIISGSESCDDGNAASGDGCSSSCTVEECWQCTGTPSVCTPKDAGTACTPDGNPCTDDVCDGAGHCGVDTCATSTTSTSTSSTTAPSTTSTSTSSSTAPAPSTTHAPTTTTKPPTTSTTMPAVGCDGTPDGPTFASIVCRLDTLFTRVSGESALGSFADKLAKSIDAARTRAAEARTLCGGGDLKKTRKHLQQAAKALSQYVHRLSGRPARKKLQEAIRTDFLQAVQAIAGDVAALRAQVACPP